MHVLQIYINDKQANHEHPMNQQINKTQQIQTHIQNLENTFWRVRVKTAPRIVIVFVTKSCIVGRFVQPLTPRSFNKQKHTNPNMFIRFSLECCESFQSGRLHFQLGKLRFITVNGK